MNAEYFDVNHLIGMAHSPITNYVVPGLNSFLIGRPSEKGTMRLFHNTRAHQERFTPHSHRFDFQSWVLRGQVTNLVWTITEDESKGDLFQTDSLIYKGQPGEYEQVEGGVNHWKYTSKTYMAGECYSMKADEVHSIIFGRETLVLFFEGPTITDRSIILQPHVDGKTIPTFNVEDWMFQREQK